MNVHVLSLFYHVSLLGEHLGLSSEISVSGAPLFETIRLYVVKPHNQYGKLNWEDYVYSAYYLVTTET